MSTALPYDLYQRRTAVYRFWNSDGHLLYVGIAWDLEARWAKHRRSSRWWPDVADHSVVWHPNRWLALAEEAGALASEAPIHNIAGTIEEARRRQAHRLTLTCGNPDGHENRSGVLARPDPELREATRAILNQHGWTMNDFLIACMVVLGQNPEGMLKRLAEVRPPAKRPGPKPGKRRKRDGGPTQ